MDFCSYLFSPEQIHIRLNYITPEMEKQPESCLKMLEIRLKT